LPIRPGIKGAEEEDKILLKKTVEVSKEADIAVIFAGLPDEYESEGAEYSLSS